MIHSEKQIERRLIDKLSLDGLAVKFVSPSMIGVPDRIVIYKGQVVFVELKAPHKTPRKSQEVCHRKFREHGARVYTLDCYEAVDGFIEALKKGVDRTY